MTDACRHHCDHDDIDMMDDEQEEEGEAQGSIGHDTHRRPGELDARQ